MKFCFDRSRGDRSKRSPLRDCRFICSCTDGPAPEMSPLEGPSPGRLSAGGKSIKLCALCASVVSVWLRPKGRAVLLHPQEML